MSRYIRAIKSIIWIFHHFLGSCFCVNRYFIALYNTDRLDIV